MLLCWQDVSGAVHSELDLSVHDGAALPAVDCVAQRGAADGALSGLLLVLHQGLEEQSEAVPAFLKHCRNVRLGWDLCLGHALYAASRIRFIHKSDIFMSA